jgi:hypothetical protein
LLPDSFALSEWQVVSESAVPSPIGERRFVIADGRLVKPNEKAVSPNFGFSGGIAAA